MKKIATLIAGAAVAVACAAPASAQEMPPLPKSPAKACALLAQDTSPESLYSFIGTKPGACQSTLASVGLDGLMAGQPPSNAAFIGNCKFLEKNVFLSGPEDTRPYPYAFYGVYEAKNRADCVSILRALHTGQISPPPFPG